MSYLRIKITIYFFTVIYKWIFALMFIVNRFDSGLEFSLFPLLTVYLFASGTIH